MKDKKGGVIGLETVKSAMLMFLILAVIGFAIMITLIEVRDVAETMDTIQGTIVNETVTPTTAGVNLSVALLGRVPNCIISSVVNATNTGLPLNVGNYSVSSCVLSNLTGEYYDKPWNVTYTYVYADSNTYDLERNVTGSVVDFFTNTSTIYAILVVIVIILAIAIIIAVVSRFGGGGRSSGGSSFGSDTVAGI